VIQVSQNSPNSWRIPRVDLGPIDSGNVFIVRAESIIESEDIFFAVALDEISFGEYYQFTFTDKRVGSNPSGYESNLQRAGQYNFKLYSGSTYVEDTVQLKEIWEEKATIK